MFSSRGFDSCSKHFPCSWQSREKRKALWKLCILPGQALIYLMYQQQSERIYVQIVSQLQQKGKDPAVTFSKLQPHLHCSWWLRGARRIKNESNLVVIFPEFPVPELEDYHTETSHWILMLSWTGKIQDSLWMPIQSWPKLSWVQNETTLEDSARSLTGGILSSSSGGQNLLCYLRGVFFFSSPCTR